MIVMSLPLSEVTVYTWGPPILYHRTPSSPRPIRNLPLFYNKTQISRSRRPHFNYFVSRGRQTYKLIILLLFV